MHLPLCINRSAHTYHMIYTYLSQPMCSKHGLNWDSTTTQTNIFTEGKVIKASTTFLKAKFQKMFTTQSPVNLTPATI